MIPAAWALAAASVSLRGLVTDPSGAAVPAAVVQLVGPGGERRARTADNGLYSFPSLAPGRYRLRVIAEGFSVAERTDVKLHDAATLDVQLVIEPDAQVIHVDDELARVSTNPAASGGAVVMRGRQIAALADDPDELAEQLQALAGPAPGPGGGQFYIDGFLGGNLPPKAAIREVRINANPFSPEYDRPGFGRIEIFTKPGTDAIRGQAFLQYNHQLLNSRNPLLAQSGRPPYEVRLYGFDLSGPLRKNKASFTLTLDRRRIRENALILATTPGGIVNEAAATPQSRTAVTPRVDWALSPKNTLVVRYQDVRVALDSQGVGDFNLRSRAYDERQTERAVQVTETAMISARALNETRFQFLRSRVRNVGDAVSPGVNVVGAFFEGAPTIGSSITDQGELTNISTYTRRTHTWKWGGRLRQSRLADTTLTNFAGTFTFFTPARYQQGAPDQFSLNAGTPKTMVNQTDVGVFVNDDWRVRPNVTLSYGVRYEAQTNLGGAGDWAPRIGIAWGLDGNAGRAAKTVLRGGIGTFYDRVPNTVTLNARRYDGSTLRSYLIRNPAFYPAIPPRSVLEANGEPQQLRPVYAGIEPPRLYQASIGIDRQIHSAARVSVSYVESRGAHLLNARNVNAPAGGIYPERDRSIRLLTESAGFSRLHQLVVTPNVNYRKLVIFGFYSLSYGKDDNEGMPADPYNLRAEWGPSTYGDVRHKAAIMTALPLPGKFHAAPFLALAGGPPYNITTGGDPNDTGFPTARPGLVAGARPGCRQAACFDLKPAAGTSIGRNYGRGPGSVNLGMRLSRTWAFGARGESRQPDGSGGMHAGGPPVGMFGASSGRKYNLTLTASTMNALNRANYAAPNGDLSSPYFGQYRSLGGMVVMMHGGKSSSYNRKIDLQLRFTF